MKADELPDAASIRARGFGVDRYELELDYRVGPNRLTARAVLTATATATLREVVLDLGRLRVTRVQVDGRPARFRHDGTTLTATPARPVSAGFTVEIRYGGNPSPVRSRWGDIGWDELTDGALVASQPTGAPSWFPCLDHPSDRASYSVTVTADAPYAVLVTGELVGRRRSAGTRTWIYERAEPTASYLMSVQIGRYEELELGPRQVASVPARLRRAAEHDLGRHAKIMKALTEWCGPYPFGSYRVVVTDDDLEDPIEAQGMAIFGANHVDGRRTHERLVVHELAHQWFGNSLTLADWSHIWLNEGFATYVEWMWSERVGDRSAASHAREWHGWAARQPADLVLADPGTARLFDARIYKRGGLALHALRVGLGDRRFFALLREWTAARRHSTVTTGAFEDLAGPEAATLLQPWLHAKPLPPLPR